MNHMRFLLLPMCILVASCSYFEGNDRKQDDFNFDQDMVTGIRIVDCTEQDPKGFCIAAKCEADDIDNCDEWIQACKNNDLKSSGNDDAANCSAR